MLRTCVLCCAVAGVVGLTVGCTGSKPPAQRDEAVTGFNRFVAAPLLRLTDAIAALLLAADLVVVAASVLSRTMLDAPWTWVDDVARGLMVALSFFGAAGALARGDNVGVAFFVDKFPPRARRLTDGDGGSRVYADPAGHPFCLIPRPGWAAPIGGAPDRE